MNNAISILKNQYFKKKILIAGLGLQGGGVGLAKFFAELGAFVHVTDVKTKEELSSSLESLQHLPISYTLGEHRVDDFLGADIIFKGPSVPWTLLEIIAAQEKKIPIEMESSFFASHCPAKIIGVTGTRGKSTTSAMIFHLMKKNTMPVFLAGNIPGVSTISLLHHVTESDWVVLELSSWQLSGFHRKKISPHVGILTNIYPDHLNYYRNMDEYIHDKKAIYQYQTDGDFLVAHKNLQKIIQGDNPKGFVIYFDPNANHIEENKSAAKEAAKIAGCKEELFEQHMADFQGLPYRLQVTANMHLREIAFINDSSSTTPTSTEKALDFFLGSSIILILGGNSKKLPWNTLMEKLKTVKQIVLLKGSFTDEILPELQRHYAGKITKVFDSLESVVEKAYEIAKTHNGKTVILFSPAATSFAMFKNEFHRGGEFDRIVRKILPE